MIKINKKILKIDIFKTLFFNFHYWGFKGIFVFPALIGKNVEFKKLKGTIICKNFETGIIQIGLNEMGICPDKTTISVIENEGDIVFYGSAHFGVGTCLSNKGKIQFGDKFVITAKSFIICNKQISFGENVLISWDCQIMDTDFHSVYDINSDKLLNEDSKVIIGNNCWICNGCTITKGVKICNDVVIASNSRIRKNVDSTNCIIGDLGQVIKENVRWEQ